LNILKAKELLEISERIKKKPDIYSGEEIIRFNKRHSIYKSLMKLEFEEALRAFQRKN
jgi:hypothetical protein